VKPIKLVDNHSSRDARKRKSTRIVKERIDILKGIAKAQDRAKKTSEKEG
jgi:hypothetical protein